MKNLSFISRVRRSLHGLRFRAQKNVVHGISSCAYEDLPSAPKDECHVDLHEVELHELEASAHLRCIDPRDKAYAIHNIAWYGNHGIQADYTITIPVLLNKILANAWDSEPPGSLRHVAE